MLPDTHLSETLGSHAWVVISPHCPVGKLGGLAILTDSVDAAETVMQTCCRMFGTGAAVVVPPDHGQESVGYALLRAYDRLQYPPVPKDPITDGYDDLFDGR